MKGAENDGKWKKLYKIKRGTWAGLGAVLERAGEGRVPGAGQVYISWASGPFSSTPLAMALLPSCRRFTR